MKPPKRVLILLLMLLMFSLLSGGCTSTSKKPMTTPAKKPNITTPAPSYPRAMANRVVSEATKVNGVRGATAVISGRMIYIGLDLNSNLNKNQSAETVRTVTNQVKKTHPGYTVTATSDIDTVTRIKKVSRGIAQGKPLTSFKTELENISNRITPRTR